MHVETFDSHARGSRLATIDPRSKLVGLLALAVVTALLTRPSSVIASFCISIALLASSGLPGKHTGKRLVYLTPFAGFAFLSIMPLRGVGQGLILFLRIMACGGYGVLLASVTPFFDLLSSLQYFRFPRIMREMLIFFHRYLLVFADQSQHISRAMKARGFKGGKNILDKQGLRVIATLAGTVLYRAYLRGMAVSKALTARRYEGNVRTMARLETKGRDIAFLTLATLSILFLLALQLGVVG